MYMNLFWEKSIFESFVAGRLAAHNEMNCQLDQPTDTDDDIWIESKSD